MSRGPALSDTQDRRAAAMYVTGMTLAQIGERFGVTASTIMKALRRLNVARRAPNNNANSENPDRTPAMVAAYREGAMLQVIGEQWGVTRERVRQILRRAGVDPGAGGVSTRWAARIDRARDKRRVRAERIGRQWGISLDVYLALVAEHGSSAAPTSPFAKYIQQRKNASTRGIGWEFTFGQWWAVWQQSGRWQERGRGKGYCMARVGDSGPYATGNVEIITIGQNFSDSYLVHPWHERFAGTIARTSTHCGRGHLNAEQRDRWGNCRACASITKRAKYALRRAEQNQQPIAA